MLHLTCFTKAFGTTVAMFSLLVVATETSAQRGVKTAPWVGETIAGAECKGQPPVSGPFDYLQKEKFAGILNTVETYHFDEGVESLTEGISTEPMGDIDFTLREFPNHHRALNSAVKFRLRHKKWPKDSKGHPAECYLQRAIKFSHRDPTPYMLYGFLLHRFNKPKEALDAYRKAYNLFPDLMLRYNMALAMVDLERWSEAKQYAKEVYDQGFPLPGLKNKLIAAGHWEPEPKSKPKSEKQKSEQPGSEEAQGAASVSDASSQPAAKDAAKEGDISEIEDSVNDEASGSEQDMSSAENADIQAGETGSTTVDAPEKSAVESTGPDTGYSESTQGAANTDDRVASMEANKPKLQTSGDPSSE